MSYEIVRFPHDGTIDADGHILEPAWLWEEYLEERYKSRAMRIKTDEEGLEYIGPMWARIMYLVMILITTPYTLRLDPIPA